MPKTIALMTGGGDCPGLNAAIRAVVRVARQQYGYEVLGIEDGFEGLIEGRLRPLDIQDVRAILRVGGTILGASNRTNPFEWTPPGATTPIDASATAMATLEASTVDALIVVGGDGTLSLAHRFAALGVPIVGIPKTIDNDVFHTEYAIGFDSCVTTVSEVIDKLHTTAESHHRVQLVEVMGRHTGWVALYGGMSGGVDVIVLPERPYTLDGIIAAIDSRRAAGRRFTIAAVAEGAPAPSGDLVYQARSGDTHGWKFGGVCHSLATDLTARCDQEVRATVLGHVQRGGSPTPFDRNLATMMGWNAVQAVAAGSTGMMTALRGGQIDLVPLADVARGPRLIPPDHPMLQAAEALGIYVG